MPANEVASFISVADNCLSASAHADQKFSRTIGETKLTFVKSRKAGRSTIYDVASQIEYGDSFKDRVRQHWHGLVHKLWGPARNARDMLERPSRIKSWLVHALTARPKPPRPSAPELDAGHASGGQEPDASGKGKVPADSDPPIDPHVDPQIDPHVDPQIAAQIAAHADAQTAQQSHSWKPIVGGSNRPPLFDASDRSSDCASSRGGSEARAAEPMRTGSALDFILSGLWPESPEVQHDGVPTRASLQNLTLDSTAAEAAFDEWLNYTGHDGPFQCSNIDRSETRLKNNRLTLVYNFAGAKFEFSFTANDQRGPQRAGRDLERMYRIATGKGGDYHNLGELVTEFMVATVQDEVAKEVKNHILSHHMDSGAASSISDPARFLMPPSKGRFTRDAQRAIDAAVKECAGQAIDRARGMAAIWKANAQGDRGDATAARIAAELRLLVAKVPEWEKEQLKATSKRELAKDIELCSSLKDTSEQERATAYSVDYAKEPTWTAKLVGFFRNKVLDKAKPHSVETRIGFQLPTTVVYVPESQQAADALGKAYHIDTDRQLKTAGELADVVFARAWHKAWRDRILSKREHAITELVRDPSGKLFGMDVDPARLERLLGPVRVGRGTFAGLDVANGAFPSQIPARNESAKSEESAPEASGSHAAPRPPVHIGPLRHIALREDEGLTSDHDALMVTLGRLLVNHERIEAAQAEKPDRERFAVHDAGAGKRTFAKLRTQ